MKHIFKYLIPAIIVGFIVSVAAHAQIASPNYWKKIGPNLYPIATSTTIGTSSVNGAFKNVIIAGTCTGSGCGGGSSVSTSSANTWSAPQTFSGGLTDASSTHIAPTYTYSVCKNPGECDYTTLEAALAQASSTQAPTSIYVHGGTYTAPSGGYQICSQNLTVSGDGQATVFNFSLGGSNAAFQMCDGTQRSWITLQNFYVHNIGSVATTVGIDFDHFALGQFRNLRVASFGTSYYASSTGSIYNKFYDNTDSPAGLYGYFIGNVVNDTHIEGERMLPGSASTTCYGIYGNGTHAINLVSDNCEFGAQVALDIGGHTHDITVSNFYSEQNAIGFQIQSTTYAVSVTGGFFGDATTTAGQAGPEEINNLGGVFCFNNVNVNYQNFSHCETNGNTPDIPWVLPYFTSLVSTNVTSSAASTVFAEEFSLPTSENICGMSFVTGSATDTGIFAGGVYGPISTRETINGAPLIVQATGTQANNTAVNTSQLLPFATTTLRGGLYYMVMQFATTTNYQRNPNQTQVVGWTQTFTNTTSTNLLPATAPSPVNSPSSMPALKLQGCSLTNTL